MSRSPINSHASSKSEAWENEGGLTAPAGDAASLGVARHMTETYSVGGYRYTNLVDAVAQARRVNAADGQTI